MSHYRLMGQFGIGQSVRRFEDARLVRGEGRFHDDVSLPGQAHAVFVRSIHAHARIRNFDAVDSSRAPGVLGVFTGADVAGLGTMKMTLKRRRPDGSPMFAPPHRGLTRDRVRYVGDPVAMVIAQTLAEAEDAAERLVIDYEPLPSVTATADAVGGPAVWDECPDNISNVHEVGDRAATDAAFAGAARVVRRRYVISRVHAQYMETRGALGVWDAGEQRYTLYADVQYPHRVRTALATNILNVPEHQIRVIVGDVGGGFGTKGWQYPEHRLVLWAARRLGRPVKWRCERREAIPADEHARDNVTDAELALDADGRFLALRVRTLANVGAYVSSDRNLLATFSNIATLVGVYTFPTAHVQVTSVLSNTNSTAPYRGAGRPEATYVIERLIDDAARELGLDAIDLRRRNLVPASAMPYRTATGVTYDCGDFSTQMEAALKLADVGGFAARRETARRRGRLRGLGVANAIERAAGPQPEFAEIRFSPSGTAMLFMGTKNQGQGHETTFKQILHERLGLDPGDVRYVDGDTDRVAFGMGSMGSRSTVIGGTAIWMAADKVIAKGRRIAAKMLEAAEADITFVNGAFAHAIAEGRRARRVSARRAAEGHRAGAVRDGDVFAAVGHVAQRLPRLRGRDRSRDGRGRARRIRDRRRRRHRDQSADAQGPDPRWRRPGRGPGAHGADRVRPGLGSAAHGLVHGLCDPARRFAAGGRRRKPSGAHEAQSARRQGCRRGRDRRRIAGGDDCGSRRAGAARRATARHAGQSRARLERDPRVLHRAKPK